ncbi:hypothetical protein KIL84_009433 [Mauremys mutica]|uniref:Uncharacterized protein n=1 Tax=Mauremys mutica TaxID=74926 RepID=A0A9D3WQ19_9SAUR|nr:hypothetical protein KIL84_009433 [Mauremys mutica]
MNLLSSFHVRVALLGWYGFYLLGSVTKFEDFLQECNRKEFKALVEEDTAAARATLQAVLDAVSSEAYAAMQDLPFDGNVLFEEQTDTKLHGLKDSCMTLQTLGLYVPAPAKPKKFKPQQTPAQATHPKYKTAYKKSWDYKRCPQRQSRPAPQPGSSKCREISVLTISVNLYDVALCYFVLSIFMTLHLA